jgi:hypothetical protein
MKKRKVVPEEMYAIKHAAQITQLKEDIQKACDKSGLDITLKVRAVKEMLRKLEKEFILELDNELKFLDIDENEPLIKFDIEEKL